MNILKHESDIWKTANLLIGAGIKQSDFPKFMMPFFALVMVESRLIREAHRLEEEVEKENMNDFIEMFRLEELGYNEFVIRNLSDYFKSETRDILNQLCDDFENTLGKNIYLAKKVLPLC